MVLTLHCSRTVAACLHALQALTVLPARTSSYKLMMTLMSDVLEMFMRALRTCMPSYTDKTVRLFFMFEMCGPQGVTGHVVAPEPTSAGRRGLEP
jgi:hypothetical protein